MTHIATWLKVDADEETVIFEDNTLKQQAILVNKIPAGGVKIQRLNEVRKSFLVVEIKTLKNICADSRRVLICSGIYPVN